MKRLFHNIEQNKRVKFADDYVDDIVEKGFWGTELGGDMDTRVWFSSKPLLSNGVFIGVAVEIPDDFDLEKYREAGDAIEDLEVEVYAIENDEANKFKRERWYVKPGEGVEA